MGCVRLLGGDTECPLHVCQLSRPSDSSHFLCRSFIRFHQSPGWLLRSEARASDLIPNFSVYKTPALSHETRPNYLKFGNLQAFRGRILTLAHPAEPHVRRNMGDSGKLRFYELDHMMSRRCGSSKPTPKRSGYGARNTRRKALEGNAGPSTRQKPPVKNLPRTAGVAGEGGRKGSRTCRIPPVWRGGTGKALWRTDHRNVTMRMQAVVDMEGNTGASTREKSCEKPSPGHRHGGGLDEEATNTQNGRWPHLQPREGRRRSAEKTK